MAALPPVSNMLLQRLRAQDLRRLRRDFVEIQLSMRKVLHAPGHALSHVYFVESGMLSLVKQLSHGALVEVGLIGPEGFYGVPLLLGAKASPLKLIVQGEGVALRMSAKRFLAHARRMPALQRLGLLYAQALHVQIEQTAACNIRHQASERLARWLLEAHDRIQKPELSLSHELLAMMLGTRRPGVTTALGVLKQSGVIGIGRRRIVLQDRDALERVSCECYRMLKTETTRLLGAPK